MQDPEKPDLEAIRAQINALNNRAAMAKQMGNEELVEQALARKLGYENALARFQEFNVGDD